MAGSAPGEVEDTTLGPFEVVADTDSISAFAEALGQQGCGPPATYPIVWLSTPALKQALREALGPGHLPIHESQSFDYERPLTQDGRYRLAGSARREPRPDRLIVTMQATDEDGRAVVAMKSVLRVVAVSGDGVE